MKIWAVANQKGGVGKTTTVVTLGGLLAEMGQRVLVVDLDPQGSLTAYFRLDPDHITHSAFDLFRTDGRVPPELTAQLIRETGTSGLSLLPASTLLATLDRRMAGVEGMGLVIRRALASVAADYDHVFLDNTPMLGVLLINALAACDHLLIPVQTEFLALKGLERMLHTLAMVAQSQRKALSYTIFGTLYDRRTSASQQSFRTLRRDYGGDCWFRPIPVDTRFRDASRLGVVPSSLAADTHGVRAYLRLLEGVVLAADTARAASGSIKIPAVS